MMIRTLAATAVLAAVSVVAAACGSGSSDAGGTDTVKVGVLLSESGPVAAQGEVQRRGVELALDEFNKNGGLDGKKVEPIYVDDGSSPDRAVELARQLIDKGVVAIIGPSYSGTCGPVQPLIEREGVFAYCLSGANFDWTPHFFAAAPPPDVALGEIPMEWAAKQHYKKISCLATSDASGDGYYQSLKVATKHLGQQLSVEKYASGDASVQTQLTKIKSESPDLIFSCASGANLVTVAKGMIALDMSQPLFAGLGSVGQPVAQAIKGSLPQGGVYALASWIDVPDSVPADLPNRDRIEQYRTDYQAKFNELPDRASADAADGMSLVLQAIKDGGDSGTEIAKDVESVGTFQGVAGTYSSFSAENHRGLTAEKIIVRFTKSGAFKYVETLP